MLTISFNENSNFPFDLPPPRSHNHTVWTCEGKAL